jgi:hypothetical protein
MSTPVPAVAQIGGQLISSFGGMLFFCPFQGNRNIEPAGMRTYLDVRRYTLNIQSIMDDTTHTGTFGAQGNEKTCEAYTFSADIIWDLRRPPDWLQKYAADGGAVIQNFNLGCRMGFMIGDDANYPSDIGAQYYYSPSMKVLKQVPIIDAETKKMVAFHMEGIGNSRIFKLPSELALFNTYATHLAGRNWVF